MVRYKKSRPFKKNVGQEIDRPTISSNNRLAGDWSEPDERYINYPYFDVRNGKYIVPARKKYNERLYKQFLQNTRNLPNQNDVPNEDKMDSVVFYEESPTYEVSPEESYEEKSYAESTLDDLYGELSGFGWHPHYENGRYYWAPNRYVYKRGGRFRKDKKFWSKEF